jgi:hypothetical protein
MLEAGEAEGLVGLGTAEIGPGFANLGAERTEFDEETVVKLEELGHPLQVVGCGIGFGAGAGGRHGGKRNRRSERAECRR